MRSAHPTLTPHELAIMKIVWRLERATTRDVYEALRERRDIAYTTVMTMMKILEEKKYLKKTQVDRAYEYRPAKPHSRSSARWCGTSWIGCSTGPPRRSCVHLARDGKLSKADKETILRMTEEIDE